MSDMTVDEKLDRAAMLVPRGRQLQRRVDRAERAFVATGKGSEFRVYLPRRREMRELDVELLPLLDEIALEAFPDETLDDGEPGHEG